MRCQYSLVYVDCFFEALAKQVENGHVEATNKVILEVPHTPFMSSPAGVFLYLRNGIN